MKYRCPFCDKAMGKKEMQFHVGIPLCMNLRKAKAETIELKIVLPNQNPDIPKLDYEYFGDRGIRNLMIYQFQRLTLGHPDEGKPIDLESFVDHSED